MIVVYLFLLFCMGICLLFKTKRYLHMLQQNLYNENNRYLKWVFHNYKALFDVDLVCLVLSFIGLFVVYDVDKFAILLIVILGLVSFFLAPSLFPNISQIAVAMLTMVVVNLILQFGRDENIEQ